VIRKRATGPGAVAGPRHEQAMLRRLSGVPGVAELAAATTDPNEILLSDTDGEALATKLCSGPLPPLVLVRLAGHLAATIAALHRNGVVHKDINPGNVVVHSSPRCGWTPSSSSPGSCRCRRTTRCSTPIWNARSPSSRPGGTMGWPAAGVASRAWHPNCGQYSPRWIATM
jgi:serine/threonine protein kinase